MLSQKDFNKVRHMKKIIEMHSEKCSCDLCDFIVSLGGSEKSSLREVEMACYLRSDEDDEESLENSEP